MGHRDIICGTMLYSLVVAEEKFYFLNIQTLCKTDDGHYLPCEIGAIEYSIKRGITKTLHRFIEPGLFYHYESVYGCNIHWFLIFRSSN